MRNEPTSKVPTDLRIEVIGSEDREGFARVVLEAFEMPAELGSMVAGILGNQAGRRALHDLPDRERSG